MKFTGERLVLGQSDKELEREHLDRYYFASQLVKKKSVLDAACGAGYGSEILACFASRVVGVDISEEAVAYAQEQYGNKRTSFLKASISSLPFEDGSFDAVVSFETLEHVDSMTQESFLREVSRVLNTDGILVISTPNREIYDKRGHNEYHVRELNSSEFYSMLSDRFQYIQLFSQKWEICDAIIGEESGTATVQNGLPAANAEYMIAVCSNTQLPRIKPQFYIREENQLASLMAWATTTDELNKQCNAHVKELDAAILEYKKENHIQKQTLEEKETELRNKEGHIAQLIESERDLWKTVREQEEALAEKESVYQRELQNKEGHIAQLIESERNLWKTVREQEEALAEKESAYQRELQNKEGHIAQLIESERDLRKTVREQEGALAEQESAYQRELQNKEGRIAQLIELEGEIKTEIARKDQSYAQQREESEAAYDALRQDYESLRQTSDAQIAQLKQTVRNKEGHIELLLESDRELERIKSTRSWRFMGYVWRLRDILIPKGSRRRLAGKMLVKFVKHPIRFLQKCTPDRIRKFSDALKREGTEGVSRRIDACLIGNQIPARPIEVREIPETGAEQTITPADYEPLAVPAWNDPLVSIVIPVYNQFDYTYLCLKSILDNSGDVRYEILIADDCSTDLTMQIDEIVSGLHTIHNQHNMRFLRNCNNAAKYARGKYILFLNNDTQVQENWLSPLVELIERSDDIGMVGSKLVYPNGMLQEAGGIIWKDGSGWNYGNRSDPDLPEYNYVKEVDYISGAAIMIRRSLWEEIGGFDERFAPAYCEDSDLAFEVRRHGYKVLYQPLSVIIHFEGISNGTDLNAGQKAYQIENEKKLYEKWRDVFQTHYDNGVNPFVARERGMGKKYLLMVDHYVPQFDKDAGSRTVFQYLRLFAEQGYQIKFIGDNYYRHEPYTTVLQQMGIEVLYGPYYARHWKDWLKENGACFGYAFLNRPHIAVNYIDEVRQYTAARIVYYGHDLHFLREAREYELTGETSKMKSAETWKRKELALMGKADMSYYPSAVEVEEIHRINADIPVKAIPAYLYSGIEKPPFAAENRRDMMFIGGFGHGPNVDAVQWLASEIMPKLTELLPDEKVFILGSNPPEEIRKLETDKLRIIGFVSDEELERFYTTCRLTIVPLRYGAGIKGKVVEAMRFGLPVVTTGIGAEGITGAESILTIVDDAETFAEKTAELYKNDELLQRRSEESFQYVLDHFSPQNAKKIICSEFDME